MKALTIAAEQLSLRDMQASDLVDVLLIERGAQLSPWSRLSFEESLTRQHICRVVEFSADGVQGRTIVGFYVICPIVDEMHILNIVVAKPFQGHGIAHVLLHDIVELSSNRQAQPAITKILLEVRSSNEVAQNCYQQWQFKKIALRKNYYRHPSGGREDALILAKLLENNN